MSDRRQNMLRWGFLAALAIQVTAVVATLMRAPGPPLYTFLRGAALFGYVSLFWAIISSEYEREMRRLFGQPFLRVHHAITRLAWMLILAHPVSVALRAGSPAVFVPVVSSVRGFLQMGGPPALYLFAMATLAALLRTTIKRAWKLFHWLNYLAFTLVFVHAWLIGSDLVSAMLRVIWAVMAGAVLLVFAVKRLAR